MTDPSLRPPPQITPQQVQDLLDEADECARQELIERDLELRIEALRQAVSQGGSDENVAANAERFYAFLCAGQD